MQITSINFLPTINYRKNLTKQEKNINNSTPVSFLAQTIKPPDLISHEREEETFFQSFLTQKGKVTIEEYNNIIKNHPSTIIKAQRYVDNKYSGLLTPEHAAKAAVELKKFYDEQYKDYTIISLGTSPALITEIMSALGSKVIFLPASGLTEIASARTKYPEIGIQHYIKTTNLGIMIDYLISKGVTPDLNDHVILLDYKCYGRSLDTLENALLQSGACKSEKLEQHSILEYLKKLLPSNNSSIKDTNAEILESLSFDMIEEMIEQISNVPHFHIDEENVNAMNPRYMSATGKTPEQLFKNFEEYSQPRARAFALCSIHEAKKLLEKNYI